MESFMILHSKYVNKVESFVMKGFQVLFVSMCLDSDRDLNASLNIRNFALADALGHSAV